ncbi:MAG: hypothetical protein K2Z81_12020, partial [Cyanobacteria bacterium]|nr:hypothetical protein [Cyanobacteriota bacterium]
IGRKPEGKSSFDYWLPRVKQPAVATKQLFASYEMMSKIYIGASLVDSKAIDRYLEVNRLLGTKGKEAYLKRSTN